MKNRKWNKRSLIIEVIITVCIGFLMFLNIMGNLQTQTQQYTYNLEKDYGVTIYNYTVSFQLITSMVKEKIAQNISFDEMNTWLQSKEEEFNQIFGDEIYDGFALTYKGGYARSWNYGDYTNYDPNTRPWYQQAAAAEGDIAIVAPYVTFLDSSYFENDDYILMTIAQKYNEEISFDLDLKISGIRDLLSEKELGYSDGQIYLIDLNGYILSSTDQKIYCRNINVSDDYISTDFGQVINDALHISDKLQLKNIDGNYSIVYCSQDDVGNSFVMIIPVFEFVAKNFFLLGFIILILMGFEIMLYRGANRTFIELKTKDERMNTILNSSFQEKVFVDLATMKCSRDMEADKDSNYIDFYQAIWNMAADKKTQQILKNNLSIEAFMNHEADNILHEYIINVQNKNQDNVEEKRVIKLGVMISMQEKHKTATILSNDITQEREDLFYVLESLAEHYYSAYLCSYETHNFEIIKAEGRHDEKINPQLSFEEAIAYYAERWVADSFQELYLSKLTMEYVKEQLSQVQSYDITVKLVNDHWVNISLIRCMGEMNENRFLMCKSDADEVMQQQEALQKALDEARMANSAKSDFLSRMSHDMRTPMNGILGVADLMSDQTDLEEINRQLQLIKMSGNYLLNLINDTLDVNKIESGRLELHKAPIKMDTILKDLFHNINHLTEEKHQKLEIQLPKMEDDKWLPIYADGPRLEQIFMNLLSNAVKYTPDGGTITFIMYEGNITEDFIEDKYVIRDTGIGMSEEFITHMYEPFSQEGRMHTNRESSTGLGLSIVKKLVDLMDGSIHVRSEMNQGTEYTITLRLERFRGEMEKQSEVIDEAILKKKRILLCEDHPLNQKIAQKLLERKEMIVDVANDGQEGTSKFLSSPENYYDLILMDIRMPVMDGYEATRVIRHADRTDAKLIPIVAMTANAFDDDVKACKEAGMNAHISKPIEVDKMYQVLATLMNTDKITK